MKKSLYAILVMILSISGAKSFAANLELGQISKVTLNSGDGVGPGGNGSVKNGVVKATK